MKISNYTLTGSRKDSIDHNHKFNLKNYCLPIMVAILMFASCKEAKPQTAKERKEAKKMEGVENTKQFYLGAVRMCLDTDYNQFFGEYREMVHTPSNGNCCTGIIPAPYINPYEFYLVLFEDEKSLFENHANPFEMKKIRENLEDRKEDVRDKVMEIDANNLVNHASWRFVKYDTNTEELLVSGSPNLSLQGNGITLLATTIGAEIINLPSELKLPMEAEKAEELFEYYKEIPPIRKLVPHSPINARITYSLKFPERNTKHSKFDAVAKKIEFYPQDNWTDKIGEITF